MMGTQEGGRRMLVIPRDLVFSSQDLRPRPMPDTTLIFVIDLKTVA
jgi:FKBP-type peptidyl-prolyl cis-trans isomerase